jgi:hypothetical protein
VAKAFLWLTTAIFGHAENVEIDIIKALSEKVRWKPMQVCDLATRQIQEFDEESTIQESMVFLQRGYITHNKTKCILIYQLL